MAGHFRIPHPNPQAWPKEPIFTQFLTPNRLEADIHSLVVEGEVPKELDGTFYRVYPDPAFPPYVENDVWINGDGIVSAFRIKDGHVDFKQRYVNTEKLQKERAARRALAGKYRNKYTDAVEFTVRTTANTNIIYHNGMLLACKEDGPPYAMNPDTLETYGPWNFNGQMESLTFTAHPKFDPVTKDMVTMGYEAKGDGTPDVCYYVVDAKGKITQTVWLVAPFPGMIHDFAFTDNWIVFPMIPLIADLERMKRGGEHFAFSTEEPCYFGVLPRYGATGKEVKWFKTNNGFMGHLSNVYEDEKGMIICDLVMGDKNVFVFWPNTDGKYSSPEGIMTNFRRVTIDPHSDDMKLPQPEHLGPYDAEFPRFDERYTGKDYTHSFLDVMVKPETDWPLIKDKTGGGFPIYNNIGHFNHKTHEWRLFNVGPTSMVQEPIFIPRTPDAAEGDGFVMAIVSRHETYSTDLVILDTRNWTKAQAIVKLPCKLRLGIHGNWVDSADRADTVTPNGANGHHNGDANGVTTNGD